MCTLVKPSFTFLHSSGEDGHTCKAPLSIPVPPDPLFEVAAAQEGLFTTAQANASGYSRQLLRHHVLGGKFVRVQRGIYRFVEFPAGTHEHLVAAWLWSEREGVLSHQTALGLHELSDALPSRIHLAVPASWRRRRLRHPQHLELHFAAVADDERTWCGPIPTTTIARTLNDCARAALSPELLRQAARQALQRGRVKVTEIPAVLAALAPFGGLDA